MKHRSWLIVSADSEAGLARAMGTGADVIVVDLDDTVAPEGRPQARERACEWLSVHRQNLLEHRRMGRWVRIGALDSGHFRDDLLAVMPGVPDGIILARASGPDDVRQLASEIYELEQRHAIPANSTGIMPVVGGTPRAAMHIADYLDTGHQRLRGLTWSASGLGAAMGCGRLRADDGGWSDACRFVRAQTLLTALGSPTMAIDAPFEHFEDEQGLVRAASAARADGFSGMFAVDPGQIPAINSAFTPKAGEIDEARELVAVFEANPDAGSLPFQGRIVDRSHLATARRFIELSESAILADSQRRSPILRPA